MPLRQKSDNYIQESEQNAKRSKLALSLKSGWHKEPESEEFDADIPMVLRNFFLLLSLSRLSGILWDLTKGVFRLCFRGVRSSRVLMGWGVDIWNRSHSVIKQQFSDEFTFNPFFFCTHINKPNFPNSTMYYKLSEIEWIWN